MGNKWRCPVAPSNENSAVRELCDRQLGACMVHIVWNRSKAFIWSSSKETSSGNH